MNLAPVMDGDTGRLPVGGVEFLADADLAAAA